MHAKRIFSLLIITFILSPLASVFGYPVYMPSDDEVAVLVRFYTRAGRVFPDATFPLSKADLSEYAGDLIDTLTLTGKAGRNLKSEVRTYRRNLGFDPGRAFYGVDAAAEAAVLLHYNAWLESSDTAGASDLTRFPNDFHTRFVEFPDRLQLALTAGVEGESGIFISSGLKRIYYPDQIPLFNGLITEDLKAASIENYMIRSGYIAQRSEHFEARFGRSPVHYGDSRFSTFLPSQNLPWLDAFTYRYRIGPLSLTSYFGTLENRVSDDEAALFGIGSGGAATGGYIFPNRNVGFDNGGVLLTNASAGAGVEQQELSFAATTILSSMHRFIFSWERFLFGITAHSLVARERNALHIGDIFPVFSWHNGLVGHHNMHLVLESSYTPMPGWALYIQAGWDDINAADLIGIPDSSLPNIGAYLIGTAYESVQGNSLKIELGSTHYLWGNYYSYHREKGGYFERAIYRYKAQSGVYWMPLTSPYGPGVRWAEFQTDLRGLDDLTVSFGGKYLSINSAADLLAVSYERNNKLEEAARINSYSLWSQLKWKMWEGGVATSDRASLILLAARPILYSYDGHVWPELELSVRIEARQFAIW